MTLTDVVIKKAKKFIGGKRGIIGMKKGKEVNYDPTKRIKILSSSNPNKLLVAQAIAAYCEAPNRYCKFHGSIDKNARKLHGFLAKHFPEGNWQQVHSQGTFDAYSLEMALAVELKTGRAGNENVVTNASVYPDKVAARYVVPEKYMHYWTEEEKEIKLDVLVVCLDRKNDMIDDYVVVDGHYWNVTESDFNGCHDLFYQMNELKELFFDIIIEKYDNPFLKKYKKGKFPGNIGIRKLISIENPVGKLE